MLLRKSLSLALISWLFLTQNVWAVTIDDELFNETKTRVNQIQLTDPNLPSWVDPKGSVGGILSRMFDNNGIIRPRFLGIFNIGTNKISSSLIDGPTITSIDAANISFWVINIARIQDASITTAKIADSAISNAKIANNAINSAKIQDNTITSSDIKSGAIFNSDINSSAAIAGTKVSPDFGSQDIFTSWNVGIWVHSPDFSLHVLGDINFSGDLRKGWDIVQFSKFLDGVEAGEIYYNGWNVGIGTSNPSAKFEVNWVMKNTSAVSTASSTIDFASTNIASTSDTWSTFTVNNILSWAAYTLVTTANATSYGQLLINAPVGFTVQYFGTRFMFINSKHIINLAVIGTVVYVTMAPQAFLSTDTHF